MKIGKESKIKLMIKVKIEAKYVPGVFQEI
jgi:hypothetical protein